MNSQNKPSNLEVPKYAPDLTEAAIRNFTELFANAKLGLDQTDPEVVEIFANFAFDDVAEISELDLRTRAMVFLAAAIGSHGVSQFKFLVGAAIDVKVTAIEIKEIVYQATAYVGMARVFDYIVATNEVFNQRGINLVNPKQSTTDRDTRLTRGLEVQKSIFGDVIDQAYANSPKDQLHIQSFLSAHCFGDFFTRSGLDLKNRELVILTILVSIGGVEPQVKAHIRANIKLGHDRSTLVSLFTQLLPWLGYPRILNSLSCLNEVSPLTDDV
jgi:4-carboxymuconolactone decarboxylase